MLFMLATPTLFDKSAFSSLLSGLALDSARALARMTFEVDDVVEVAREADFLTGYVQSMPLD
jgi:hypothetical protein